MGRIIGLLTVIILWQSTALSSGSETKTRANKKVSALSRPLLIQPSNDSPAKKWITDLFHFSNLSGSRKAPPHPESTPGEIKSETNSRTQLANQIIREKAETILKTQVVERFRSYLLKQNLFSQPLFDNLKKKLDSLNNVALFSPQSAASSSSNFSTCTVKMGIDLRNSNSKLEYIDKNFEMGLYHNRTLTAITGREPLAQNLSFRVNKKWEQPQIKASFDFPLAMPTYRASISHDFSASISSTLSAQAPARGTEVARRIDLKFAILF